MSLSDYQPDAEDLKMLESIEEDYENENWQKAAEGYEQLLDKWDEHEYLDEDVVKKLCLCYHNMNQHKKATRTLSMIRPRLIANANKGSFALKILLPAGMFIEAHKIISRYPEKSRAKYLKQIEEAEDIARQQFGESIKTTMRSLSKIDDCKMPEAQKRIAEAEKLPKKEFVSTVKYILMDPFTSIMFKTQLFEILQSIKLDEDVPFIWIDEKEYSANPAKLDFFEDSNMWEVALEYLRQKLDDDPYTLKTVRGPLFLQLMLLYPKYGLDTEFIHADAGQPSLQEYVEGLISIAKDDHKRCTIWFADVNALIVQCLEDFKRKNL
ncbi:MAG: hypothetical protein Q3959_05980 [Limosilactobacillus sp.]|uniref:hypothetical protein n=1 Tax=Limosilactobacillus sp. TaxID=2773925 RepID=UPI002709CB47|nr:hypothetical protein [Limosilactobacillus sp.]